MFFFFAVPVWASTAFIDNFNCTLADYQVWRNKIQLVGKPTFKFENLGKLLTGDQVIVLKDSCFIKLSDDGKVISLTKGQKPPYIVMGSQIPSAIDGIIDVTWKAIESWYTYKKDWGEVATRNEDAGSLSMPLLQREYPELLLSTKQELRELYLTWKGGQSPFEVNICYDKCLIRNGNQIKNGIPQLRIPKIELREVKLPSFEFVDGQKYEVVISDDKDRKRGSFIAIYKKTIFPSEIEVPGLTEQTKQLFRATWLVKQNRNWKFDAYQQIAKYSAGNPARIKELLRIGKPF